MIGVFDSGVGGLSVLKAIREQQAELDFIYIADSAHAPYGERSTDFIEARATRITATLLDAGARAIVIACNTATAVAVQKLRAAVPVPIIAMEPAIKPAVAHTRSGVVAVLATQRTLESAGVQRLCREFGHGVKLLLKPCPGLVELVERGELDSPATRELLLSLIAPLLEQGVDTLVLGCTHYVFLAPTIRTLVGPAVHIVESSAAVARQTLRCLDAQTPPQPSRGTRRELFLTTGAPTSAAAVFTQLWGAPVTVAALAADSVGA